MSETEISSLGEFGLIDQLTRDFKVKNASTLRGVGDDCAVLDYGSKKTLAEARTRFGLVFQNFNLFPHRTVLQNISDAPILVKKLHLPYKIIWKTEKP